MREVLVFGKCMSDSVGLRIIALLREGELCSCEIKDVLRDAGGGVDAKLRMLGQAGIVRSRRRDGWTAYRLASKYTDLVETVFETFDSVLSWDGDLTADHEKLIEDLRDRVGVWCTQRGRDRSAV